MSFRRSLLRPLIPVWQRATGVPFATALRRSLAQGYDASALRADVLAGLVVGVVALPLSMALAIAVGVPPQHGLYTAIVAGSLVALTGGSKFQVTGPTAAFVVILAPVVTRHGIDGLLTAGCMAGVLLVAMGMARFGRLIEFIPHPVTTGFTTGIATVIATLQIKDVFALPVAKLPESYLEKVEALWAVRAEAQVGDAGLALLTLLLLLALPRWLPGVTRRVPGPLIAIVGVTLLAGALQQVWPELAFATIGKRFQTTIDGQLVAGIPSLPPLPRLPWGDTPLSFGLLRDLAGAAFAIAMLGAIESLLSAVIADGLTGKRHDPDAELVGLGLGNLLAPFFGGIAATGALARTATNIRAGARSPLAAVVHSLVILLAVLLLAPLFAHVPMAALAGLLLVVAWNMSEVKHFVHTLRVAPRDDVIVLLICFGLTVVFDMVLAVSVGVVLASLMFMRRMAELTHSRVFEGTSADTERALPAGVTLYEIAGPLFFGAAQSAMGAIHTVGATSKVIVLALGQVPAIDATGLVALESALSRLRQVGKRVVLAGPLPEPREIFTKANLQESFDNVEVADTLADALEKARVLVESGEK
jgi:SulP family sulfate permease